MKNLIMVLCMVFLFAENGFAQWEQIGTANSFSSNTLTVYAIGFVGTTTIVCTAQDGIKLSDDNGNNWRSPSGNYPENSSIYKPYFLGSLELNGNIYFGSGETNVGVYKSSDGGENWGTLSNGLGVYTTTILGYYNGKIFLGSDKLYYSEDEGETWQVSTAGLPVIGGANHVTFNNGTYFGAANWVYKSTDGINWEVTENNGLPNKYIQDFVSSGNNLVAAVLTDSLYYSSDGGDNWVIGTGFNSDTYITSLIVQDGRIFASTNRFFYVSDDDGETWNEFLFDGEFNPMSISVFNAGNGMLFAGTKAYNGGYFGRTELTVTDVKEQLTSLKSFSLKQNFPNPFNPNTTINYSIPTDGYVSLKVYDLLGNIVSTLVSERKNAGSYTATFDAEYSQTKLVSGVYIYRLQFNGQVESKKFILIK